MLEVQAALLTTVATGGPRINEVNGQYKERRSLLHAALNDYGIDDPFPWTDLWLWHGHWTQHLPAWADRRRYIAELTAPALARLEVLIDGVGVDDSGALDTSTWPALGSRLDEAKRRNEAAASLDDWQDVGRRCREILIDLANLVYTPDMLPPSEPEPKGSDAKVRLAHATSALFAGPERKELRALIRSAWDLANTVTHAGHTAAVDAFATLQATVLLVRVFERAQDAADEPPF